MNIINVVRNKATFIESNQCNEVLSKRELLVGNSKNNSYRTLINFDVKKQYLNKNFEKVELVIYLNSIDISDNIECFMLNVAINLASFNEKLVDWKTKPKIYEQCLVYRFCRKFRKNFIRLDVTDIVRTLFKHNYKEVGFTLIGLSDSSLIFIENESFKKYPFLRFYYKSCNRKPLIAKPQIGIFDDNYNKEICDYNEEIKNQYDGDIDDLDYAYLSNIINEDESLIESKNFKDILVDEDKEQFILGAERVYFLEGVIEVKSDEQLKVLFVLSNYDKNMELYNCNMKDGEIKINLKIENKEAGGILRFNLQKYIKKSKIKYLIKIR